MTQTTPVVFLDTETTGLSLSDDVWEVAAIRRDPDGEAELHMFLEHDPAKCARLPEAFAADHRARYRASVAVTPGEAARRLLAFFVGRPHVVGAVPNFDTERLAMLGERQLGDDWRTPWHYHLVDVENLAVGYLAAQGRVVSLPWDSDELSAALGVVPPVGQRHTAMGDARWARDIYDRILGGAQ